MYVCMYVCMCTCYSAPSRFLLRGAPEDSADTGSEFHAEAHEQLRVKDLLKVPRHNDRWDGARTRNLRVTGQALQPVGHRASHIHIHTYIHIHIYYTYIHIRTSIHIHTYIYAYVYTYIHI